MNRREFAKLCSYAAIFFPLKNVAGNISATGLPVNEDEIKSRAVAAFKRFEQVWDFNDFWKRGNTFDACLTFADALHTKWPKDPEVMAIQKKIGDMLKEDYRFFHSIDPAQMWADDFGWWGLMGINARKHLKRIGNDDLAEKFTQLSIYSCWQQERDHAYDFSDSAKPVPNGCSNGDANGQNKGAKNTVTNVLFFLLSSRLYSLSVAEDLPNKEGFLDMAYRQWRWFDSWFNLEQYHYLQQISTGGVLVHERPKAFFEGSDYTETNHPTWEKGWLWTGDQGMLLAALHEISSFKNDLSGWVIKNKITPGFTLEKFEKEVTKYIWLLNQGVKSALVSNKDDIIREAPFNANFGPEFGNDYLAGRGIMMRYLGKLNKTGKIDFSQNFKATASAIWQTRDKATNEFKPEFTSAENDKLYVDQYRRLTGFGDEVHQWQIEAMNEKQKNGVCQSIGMDALGAVIRNL
jgi:hypothetical protein